MRAAETFHAQTTLTPNRSAIAAVYSATSRTTEADVMWESIHALLIGHPKALGVLGDSFTFIGSLLMAAEALWKKTERIAIATKKTIVKYFPTAEDEKGKPVSPTVVEEKWSNRWNVASKSGVIVLAAGFALLLAHRILFTE